MPLYIKDETTTRLVNELARRRGLTKQRAVRLAVEAELAREERAVPLRERLIRFWEANPPCRRAPDRTPIRLFSMSCQASRDNLCRRFCLGGVDRPGERGGRLRRLSGYGSTSRLLSIIRLGNGGRPYALLQL